MSALLDRICEIFDGHAIADDEALLLLEEVILGLERGEIRVARKIEERWLVDPRVKKSILLAFRLGQKVKSTIGPFTFIDKENLFPRELEMTDGVRVVPGGSSVRRGAHLGRGVVIMPPSYVNIGAYIDDDSMIDSNALVGSCAQVGKRVHISAGAQIGGVLEPIGAMPVIIEDHCLIGGNVGIFEGVRIGQGAVIGAGVNLTQSTKIFDMVNEKIIAADDDGVIEIPKSAVVIAGARALNSDFAIKNRLSIATPIIIKYRDDKTSKKAALEEMLRT